MDDNPYMKWKIKFHGSKHQPDDHLLITNHFQHNELENHIKSPFSMGKSSISMDNYGKSPFSMGKSTISREIPGYDEQFP